VSVSSTVNLFLTIQGAVEPAGSWQCEDRVLTPTSLQRKKERGEEAVAGVLAMRQNSPATSLRRKSDTMEAEVSGSLRRTPSRPSADPAPAGLRARR